MDLVSFLYSSMGRTVPAVPPCAFPSPTTHRKWENETHPPQLSLLCPPHLPSLLIPWPLWSWHRWATFGNRRFSSFLITLESFYLSEVGTLILVSSAGLISIGENVQGRICKSLVVAYVGCPENSVYSWISIELKSLLLISYLNFLPSPPVSCLFFSSASQILFFWFQGGFVFLLACFCFFLPFLLLLCCFLSTK